MDHEQLPGLLDAINKGFVGSPFAALPLANVAAVGTKGQGASRTLINMTPDTDHRGQSMKLGRVPRMITASIFGIGGGAMGPLVGVASWGSGNGAQQSIEFDIPTNGDGNSSGGAILAVPCTSLTIAARNDGNVIPAGSTAPIGAVFGPVASGSLPAATVSVGLGPKQGNAQLTRTIWAASTALAALGSVIVAVPAWAQRFRILRFDASNTISVVIGTVGLQTIGGPYNEAANAPPVLYPLPSTASQIQITNTGAGVITFMAVVFELGL